MLEIKCVYSREIVDGYVKPEYYQQMQGQMHTAELEECDFLECKITEYDSEAAFVADASPDESARGTALTAAGMEKGAITFHYDNEQGKEVYGYSPYETSTAGVIAWAAAQEEFKTVVFYKMDVYNCQRIAYDTSFMEETEPKIRDSYALFTKYRDCPENIDLDYPESAKKTRTKQGTRLVRVRRDRAPEDRLRGRQPPPLLRPLRFVRRLRTLAGDRARPLSRPGRGSPPPSSSRSRLCEGTQMRLVLPMAVLLVVALAAALAGSRVEAFGDANVTALDRLCEVVGVINVDDETVKALCQKHRERLGADFCVKGCDPASLCRIPALEQCASGSRNCDVTHLYVGPHISSFNNLLPRFFLVKHGFCLGIDTNNLIPWTARVDRALLEVMLAFPKAFVVPQLDGAMHAVKDHWLLDTSGPSFQVPFSGPPQLPAFLAYNDKDAIPVRTPAFAVYETSTSVDGSRTWREVHLQQDLTDEKTGLIMRDIRERRPASPDKMVFAIFRRFAGDVDGEANCGVHKYVYTSGNKILSTFGMGDMQLGEGPVSLLSSVVVDMKHRGKVLEVREIVYNAGVYRLVYKVPTQNQCFGLEACSNTLDADRYFLGALDPVSCMEMLEGEA